MACYPISGNLCRTTRTKLATGLKSYAKFYNTYKRIALTELLRFIMDFDDDDSTAFTGVPTKVFDRTGIVVEVITGVGFFDLSLRKLDKKKFNMRLNCKEMKHNYTV